MKTTKISDLIKESYLNYVSKDKCGLVLVSLPTALGKTYACCDAIASWCAGKPSDDRRHVVFITPLLKNLPERDLMEAFQRHGIDYKSNVLVIRSYRDCIVEANKKGLLRKILLGLLPESHADFFMGDEKALTCRMKTMSLKSGKDSSGEASEGSSGNCPRRMKQPARPQTKERKNLSRTRLVRRPQNPNRRKAGASLRPSQPILRTAGSAKYTRRSMKKDTLFS